MDAIGKVKGDTAGLDIMIGSRGSTSKARE